MPYRPSKHAILLFAWGLKNVKNGKNRYNFVELQQYCRWGMNMGGRNLLKTLYIIFCVILLCKYALLCVMYNIPYNILILSDVNY